MLETADGRYIFAMAKQCHRLGDHVVDQVVGPYTRSGLYRNDGSTTPLWTVDWCAYVLLPSDGVHLIRTGPWARTREGRSAEALSFFANGELLKTYTVGDFVLLPSLLPHSVSHFTWLRGLVEDGEGLALPFTGYSKKKSDHTSGRHATEARVETLQGDRYTIDLATGNIVSSRRPVRTALMVLLVVGVVAYAVRLWRAANRPVRSTPALLSAKGFYALTAAWLVAVFGVIIGRYLSSVYSFGASERGGWSIVVEAITRLLVLVPLETTTRFFSTPQHLYYSSFAGAFLFASWLLAFAPLLVADGVLEACSARLGLRQTRDRKFGEGLPGQGILAESHTSFHEIQRIRPLWLVAPVYALSAGLLAGFYRFADVRSAFGASSLETWVTLQPARRGAPPERWQGGVRGVPYGG